MSRMTELQAVPLIGRLVIVMAREVDNRQERSEPIPFPGTVVGFGHVVRGHKAPRALILRDVPGASLEGFTVITFGRVARVLDWNSGRVLFTELRSG